MDSRELLSRHEQSGKGAGFLTLRSVIIKSVQCADVAVLVLETKLPWAVASSRASLASCPSRVFYFFWLAEGWEKPLRLLQNLLAPGLTSSLALVVSQIGGPIFAASMSTTRVGLGSADMARVVGKAVHKQKFILSPVSFPPHSIHVSCSSISLLFRGPPSIVVCASASD